MSEDLTKKLPKSDSENIAVILTTVQNLDTRLTNLENKVDERLHDTRPIWEKVVADIAQVQGEVHEIKISVREISYQIGAIGDTLVRSQGKNKELEERVRDLEQHPKLKNSST